LVKLAVLVVAAAVLHLSLGLEEAVLLTKDMLAVLPLREILDLAEEVAVALVPLGQRAVAIIQAQVVMVEQALQRQSMAHR
jgi:hypothetical protein